MMSSLSGTQMAMALLIHTTTISMEIGIQIRKKLMQELILMIS